MIKVQLKICGLCFQPSFIIMCWWWIIYISWLDQAFQIKYFDEKINLWRGLTYALLKLCKWFCIYPATWFGFYVCFELINWYFRTPALICGEMKHGHKFPTSYILVNLGYNSSNLRIMFSIKHFTWNGYYGENFKTENGLAHKLTVDKIIYFPGEDQWRPTYSYENICLAQLFILVRLNATYNRLYTHILYFFARIIIFLHKLSLIFMKATLS